MNAPNTTTGTMRNGTYSPSVASHESNKPLTKPELSRRMRRHRVPGTTAYAPAKIRREEATLTAVNVPSSWIEE